MIKLTRTEVKWIVNSLLEDASRYKEASKKDGVSYGLEKNLMALKSEQLESIANRLNKSFVSKDKRIAID